MSNTSANSAAMEKYRDACTKFFQQIYVGEERHLVFGEGKMSPQLMLIGEAPGEQEALQGRPFVGKAGQNLDAFLRSVNMQREDLYISNAVKVRPTKTSVKGRVSNRPPTREEVALFAPWLIKEIALVKPAAIATLGNVALHAVSGKLMLVGQSHGSWMQLEGLPPLFPLYHPASVIYNPGLALVYEQDIHALSESLAQGQYQNDI